MKTVLILALCGVCAMSISAAGGAAPTAAPKPPAKMSLSATGKTVTTKSGLKYVDLVVGKGAMPKVGQTISVLYTGKLTSGKIFDSTSTRNNQPFETPIGVGMRGC